MARGARRVSTVLATAALVVALLPSATFAARPRLSVSDLTVAEQDADTVATFVVRLSPASSRRVGVNFNTADGTAVNASDYSGTAGALIFRPGQRRKLVRVPVTGDTLSEAAERFSLTLTSPSRASISRATGTATITDNDPLPVVQFTSGSASGGESSTSPTVKVSLSSVSGQQVTVGVTATGGTATVADDFTVHSPVSFAPGEVSADVPLTIVDDNVAETDETAQLTLGNAVGAAIGSPGTFTYTLDDNDPSSLTVAPASPTKVQDQTQQFSATLNYLDGSTVVVTPSATWSSLDTSIATVNDLASKGRASAINAGTTSIKAAAQGLEGSASMTVTCRSHTNGVASPFQDSYFHCAPLGTPGTASTYSLSMATAAANAWTTQSAHGPVVQATCSNGASVVYTSGVLSGQTYTATWSYTGTFAGYALAIEGTTPFCTTSTGSSTPWN
jgi:hypothetical protein